jgi:DNA-binding beta-propeller fold protein YncE
MSYRIGFSLFLVACACVLPSSAQSLVTDIAVPGTPYGIAVNPNNNRIYVSLSTSTGPAIGVIDGSTNTVVDTVATSQGSSLVAVNIATGRVYAAGCNNNQTPACGVTVIDGTSDTVIAIIPINGPANGIGVQGIAVNPVTNRIYVSDDLNYELEVIDGNTNTASYMNTGKAEMLGLAVDFGTNQILGTPSGDVLDIINGTTHAITRVKVGMINQDVAVNSFTSRAYVTDDSGVTNTLGVINLNAQKVIANIPIGTSAFGVSVDYLSNLVFVAVQNTDGNGNVTEVDGKTNTVKGTVSANAQYVDVNPATRLVYASDNFLTSVVHVISE